MTKNGPKVSKNGTSTLVHLKKSFRIRISFQIYYSIGCKNEKKLNLSQIIFLTYFRTEKYRAVEKNDFFNRERGLAVKGLINFNLSYSNNAVMI